MAFDHALRAKDAQTSYRQAVREARIAAIKLAKRLVEDAESGKGEPNPDAVKAMAEILKEARELFPPKQAKKTGAKAGIRGGMSLEEAERAAEEGDE